MQALEAVLDPPRADILVCVSHEGETELTMEAERAFGGEVWLVTGRADSPLAEFVDEVVVCTPELERSWCHTASYTCAVAALHALHGEDIALASGRGRGRRCARPCRVRQERVLDRRRRPRLADRAGGGAQAAGGRVGRCLAFETEQLLHGHLAAVDAGTARSCSRARAVAAERAADALRALDALGCETTLLPTRHPVVDIVRFHLLTLAEAPRRAARSDPIRATPGSPLAEATGASAYPLRKSRRARRAGARPRPRCCSGRCPTRTAPSARPRRRMISTA